MTKAPAKSARKKVTPAEAVSPATPEVAAEPSIEIAPAREALPVPPSPSGAPAPPQMVMPGMPPGFQQMLMAQQRPPPHRIYVSFSAEINAHTTESLIALCSQHVNQGVKEIYLMLSTPGGAVMNGLNLYNVLRALPINLITHNVGNVDSIGNAVFLAGKERYACQHSTFMFHGVGFSTPNATHFEEKSLRERLGSVLADQKRIGSIIGERTGLKKGEIGNLFKEARTKDADYARRVGIVHDIRDAEIPEGAPVFALVFQR
jgi:ATP-dependent protease ClpP protease subunit